MSRNIEIIKSNNGDGLPNSLNGPEVSVSVVNVCSMKMLLRSIKKHKENCEPFNHNKVNLPSCMTLPVENLHSAVNRRQGTQTLVSYMEDFETTIKESIKPVTNWGVHYFTTRERWYWLPDSAVSLASLQFPNRTKNLSGKTLNSDQKRRTLEWGSGNEAIIRQRSDWQEAIENAYFEELTLIFSNEDTNTDEKSVEEEIIEEEGDVQESKDEITEFESESDVEATSGEENDEGHLDSLTNVAKFPAGPSFRFGRNIKLNKECIA